MESLSQAVADYNTNFPAKLFCTTARNGSPKESCLLAASSRHAKLFASLLLVATEYQRQWHVIEIVTCHLSTEPGAFTASALMQTLDGDLHIVFNLEVEQPRDDKIGAIKRRQKRSAVRWLRPGQARLAGAWLRPWAKTWPRNLA